MDTNEMKFPKLAAAVQDIINRYGSKAEAARKLKTNATSVGYYLEGNREPTLKTLAMIANEVGKSPSELMGINGTLSATEAPDTVNMDATVRDQTMNYYVGSGVARASRTVPVISKVQAGDFGFWEDAYPVGEGMTRIECPADIMDPHAFAVQVEGDSMYPRYMQGEFVIVDTTKPIMNNDDVVVKLHDGAVMVKRYKMMRDMVFLESYNPSVEPIPVLDGDMLCCYKIVCRK